jgi:phage terminase large subunit
MILRLAGKPNPKQADFFKATSRHVAYGGSRGGGKSWAMRRKFVLLALNYPNLKLLLLRRTLPELRENHVLPLLSELHGIAQYKDTEKAFIFPNGSRIKLGYCDTEKDIFQYQGQEYDVIGLEEATHFTEAMRDFLTTCNRSTRTDFSPRMYYTSNPGNVGHQWFKRLFIDRDYRGREKAEDFVFIQAKVYDNTVLMETNPEYVESLENLPEDMRKAHLEGDWDAFAGQYFTEFKRDIHVIEPFEIPKHWKRYTTMDYGLDMLAFYWIAMDTEYNAYIYKEVYQNNLIISDAAKKIKETENETVTIRYAPPDLWNRRQDTGKSASDIFGECGLFLNKATNDRVQGWYNFKEWLKPIETRDEQTGKTTIKARLKIFNNCSNLIRCIPQAQHDERDPNDIANTPHEITHSIDAIRYFLADRPIATDKPQAKDDDEDEDIIHQSNTFFT